MSETARTYGKQTAVIDGVLVRIAPAHRQLFIERYPDAEYLNNWEFRQRFAQGMRKGRSWDYVKDLEPTLNTAFETLYRKVKT